MSEHSFATSLPYADLSPVEVIETIAGTVFQSPDLARFWSAMSWLLGLGGIALSLMFLRRIRSGLVLGVLAVSVAAAGVGAARLVPAQAIVRGLPDRAIAYEPVCVERSIPVCLHPAYEAVLDEIADLVDGIVRPVVGVPGAPVRAEQSRPPRVGIEPSPWNREPLGPDTLPIAPIGDEVVPEFRAQVLASDVVAVPTNEFPRLTPAQSAIATWLMEQAGWDTTLEPYAFVPFGVASTNEEVDAFMAEVRVAADRFAVLSPDEQRAWLEANFAALRAGELTLEDLP